MRVDFENFALSGLTFFFPPLFPSNFFARRLVQSISFINWLVVQHDCIGPYLVIAPLSTLPHWQREVEAWTDLNCILYHGDQESRRIITEFETHYRNERGGKVGGPLKFHILLTSPEMAMSDESFLSKIQWEALICDEAQVGANLH
jgi:SNF2 family DNA or RNA helicase